MNDKIEVISNVFQITSVLIGVLMIWWQIRAQRKVASAQLYISLSMQFHEPQYKAQRLETAQGIAAFLNGASVERISHRLPMLSVLESCGEMAIQRVISDQEITSGFGWYAHGYYYLLLKGRPDVDFFESERKIQSDSWFGIERIYNLYVSKYRILDLSDQERMTLAQELLAHELAIDVIKFK